MGAAWPRSSGPVIAPAPRAASAARRAPTSAGTTHHAARCPRPSAPALRSRAARTIIRANRAATGSGCRRRTPSLRARKQRSPPSCHAARCRAGGGASAERRVAGVGEHERAGAVSRLGRRRARSRPGRSSPPAGRRRGRRSGSARRTASSSPKVAGAVDHLGQRARAARRTGRQPLVPARPCQRCPSAACGWRCRVGDVRAPPVSLNTSQLSTVPTPAGRRAASRNRRLVVQRQRILVAEK